MKKGPSKYAKYWTSEYNEGRHFGDHGKSMGCNDNDEGKESYSKAAYEFFNSKSETLQSFTAEDGTTYKYDPVTNEFEIISKRGTIVTYYKPRDGLKYFLRQYKRYGGKWN